MNKEQVEYIVLFDGYCNLCSWSVQFIIRNDPERIFRFLPLQSEKTSLKWPDLVSGKDYRTLVLIAGDKKYYRSAAALKIAGKLRFPVNLLRLFFIIPAFLRDPVYCRISRNRYKWFGKRNVCFVPEGVERNMGHGLNGENSKYF